MRSNDLTRLDTRPALETHIVDWVLQRAKDKSVLNVGAAGGVRGYLPNNREAWLHHQIGRVAKDLVGIDIDEEGIVYASRHGVEIFKTNCETMDLMREFEIIVLSDVIEHLDAPVIGIRNLMRHLSQDGRLLITTPNPTSSNTIARVIAGRLINVYYDHVTCFMPEHIQGICDRYGYEVEGFLFFDHLDKRNMVIRGKSIAARVISMVNHRLATSFMAIIKHGK
ncbi:MAG: methyltransferase domain-containing protein [Nitrospirota bacterium]